MKDIKSSNILSSKELELNKLIKYLIDDVSDLEIECISVFGSSTFDDLYCKEYSDIDIIAYSQKFCRKTSESCIQIIKSKGGIFKDKKPIFIEDFISPRIEYIYIIDGVVFDINIFPCYLNGLDSLYDNVLHDSVDTIIGSMYEQAIVLYGKIPFENIIKIEFLPFYSEEIRRARLNMLEIRINSLILRIKENLSIKNIDIISYILKLKFYFMKWIFIYHKKYPLDLNKHIEYQLNKLLCLPQNIIDALALRSGNNIIDIYNNFINTIQDYINKDNTNKFILNISDYFGNYKQSNLPLLTQYIGMLDHAIEKYRNYGFPFLKGNYVLDYYENLKNSYLNNNPMSPREIFNYLAHYFSNVPDWSNPGTMINVIPPVNIISAAAVSVAECFNPNFAQDTYSGNLILSELEVGKYISELLGWNWEESSYIFTFGGTGTNLYGTKLAICNADPDSQINGVKQDAYFILTSKNGHPCHYQLCDWLGIGSNSCIEIPCDKDGKIDIFCAESVIHENLKKGKIFLGFNLNGGSTNEMTIDPIKKIYELRENITFKYKLNYIPKIHVDSVLGWIYLFFSGYNFALNKLNLNQKYLGKIESIYNRVKEFKYADSLGIDFHKTGFCPYVTSLFLVQDKKYFYLLNKEKEISLKSLYYGDYNPFLTSLEYSRSCHGPIAALSSLKSLGKNGFRQLICNLYSSTCYFRELLLKNNNLCVIDKNNDGLATIFVIIPKNFPRFSEEEIFLFDDEKISYIRNFNLGFGRYIVSQSIKNKISFFFTSSRSYTIPRSNINIGALKIYPMSIFLDNNEVERIIYELDNTINQYINNKSIENFFSNQQNDFFHDMSRV